MKIVSIFTAVLAVAFCSAQPVSADTNDTAEIQRGTNRFKLRWSDPNSNGFARALVFRRRGTNWLPHDTNAIAYIGTNHQRRTRTNWTNVLDRTEEQPSDRFKGLKTP